jgi:hypothetical protein
VNAGRLVPEFDPRLVEAAVLGAMRGRALERDFHAERDALYEIGEPEPRECAFEALHARWFERLALDRAFTEALAEHPELAARCRRCLIASARDRRDEVADLLVTPDDRPTLVVLVTPETVAVPERLRVLLRRELLRVADMLDPRFGYEPAPPAGVAGGPREWAVRDGYRVLWDAYVDGRLVRLGVLPPTARRERQGEFVRAFGHLGADADVAFDRFFGGQELTHAEFVAFTARRRTGTAGDCPRGEIRGRI